MVLDHEAEDPSRWAAALSISAKTGCSAHTLLDWVKRVEVDSGKRAGVPSDMAEKLKALERECCELRLANEILRKGVGLFCLRAAPFADAEFDRRFKPQSLSLMISTGFMVSSRSASYCRLHHQPISTTRPSAPILGFGRLGPSGMRFCCRKSSAFIRHISGSMACGSCGGD